MTFPVPENFPIMSQKERREVFAQALESGQYEQTFNVLHRLRDLSLDDGGTIQAGYCCLGVGLDLLVKAGMAITAPVDEGDIAEYLVSGDPSYQRMRSAWDPYTQSIFGLDPFDTLHLTRANDSGSPFSMIASEIRKIK